MTRPRIHSQEATYLLKILTNEKQRLLTNDAELAVLDREVQELRVLLFACPSEAFKGGYVEKKKRYVELEKTKFARHTEIKLLETLIAKYDLIANGKGKGRYGGKAANVPLYLTIHRSHKHD